MSLEIELRAQLGSFSLAISLSAGNERVAILGPSGAGKSAALKCVAGIYRPDSGRVVADGRVLFDSARGINVPSRDREVGYLFQGGALFPTMTVAGNVGAGLFRLDRPERDARVAVALERMSLSSLAKRYPRTLSGGERQRVALARVLVTEPRVLLLDEPLTALDSSLRAQVESVIAEALDSFPGTSVIVTHDRDEAYRLADRVAIIDEGRTAEVGPRDEVFARPTSLAGARLVGCRNLSRAIRAGKRRIAIPAWGLILDTDRDVPDGLAYAGIHAHDVRTRAAGDDVNCFDFLVSAAAEAPYRVVERAIALTPPGVAGGTGVPREALRVERDYARTATPASTPRRETLCIPHDRILMFS